MILTAQDIEDKVKEQVEGVVNVTATDLKGGNHWGLEVTASAFNGLNRVKQQQLIYKVLADELADETIHALTIQANGTE